MFEMQPYIVYIKPDAQNRIQAVDSSAFLRETDGWREIDRGFDDKHHHAQGNYFPKPIYDERGIMRYKTVRLVDWPEGGGTFCEYMHGGEEYGVFERTQEEMDADYIPHVQSTDSKDIEIQNLKDQVAALSAAFLNM